MDTVLATLALIAFCCLVVFVFIIEPRLNWNRKGD